VGLISTEVDLSTHHFDQYNNMMVVIGRGKNKKELTPG
jgi:hypothetical protein